MTQGLEQRLEEYYAPVPPAPGGLQAGREQFLAEAARLHAVLPVAVVAQRGVRHRRRGWALAYQLLSVVLLIALGLGVTGGGMALASTDSLPGDLLYPVKLTVEDVRLSLAKDPATRAMQTMGYVSERADELSMLVMLGDVVPGESVQRMLQQMDQVMMHISQASPEEAPGLLARYAETVRVQQLTLARIQGESHDGMQLAVYTALQAMEQTYSDVHYAQVDPAQEQYQLRFAQDNPGASGASDVAEPAEKPAGGGLALPANKPPEETPVAAITPAKVGEENSQKPVGTPIPTGTCKDCPGNGLEPGETSGPNPDSRQAEDPASAGAGSDAVVAVTGEAPGPADGQEPQQNQNKSSDSGSGSASAPDGRGSDVPPRMRRRVIPQGEF